MTWAPSSALAPAGPHAARLAHLYWVFFGVCAVVYVVMMVLLIVALAGGPSPAFDEKRRLRLVAVGGAITTVVLLVLLVASVRAGRGLNPMPEAEDQTGTLGGFLGPPATTSLGKAQLRQRGGAVTVKVIARQWWWEFQYPGNAPDQLVVTANELHIPAGTPVLLQLISRDVIHSFWVPALHGKRDLIPGHDSTTYIQADQPGRWRGQCAEFCGAQHAKMGILVVADPPDQFEKWLAQQRQPAPEPTSPQAIRGRDTFLRSACPMCHTIDGTIAGAAMGPNLTHVAGRTTLAAGSLPNVRGHLAGWIEDSQGIKPGNRMPPLPLRGSELQDLLAYLETLR